MLRTVLRKMRGTAVVLANLPGQRRIPFLSRERIDALRDSRLRATVCYAARTVPYYRELFREQGIDPREIRSIEDLDRLPLLDKQLVRENPARFVSTSRKGRNSIPFVSSGSTARPVEIRHDEDSLLANIAYGERERQVRVTSLGTELGYREVYIGYPGGVVGKVKDLYRQRSYIPFRPKRLELSITQPVEEIVGVLNDFRPDALLGFGSYLEVFFRIVLSRGLSLHLPRLVLYGADAMTNPGRRFIEEEVGIPVLSTYQAVESFKIGFFCESRSGFHLHEDLCHVKIVNPSGDEVKNGEAGEVVISNLVNRGTVLLNFRLGDVASISSRTCPCGRSLRILSELEGRTEDTIFLPDGRFVHPRLVWRVFKGRNEVLQYQLIQHEPQRFEIRLVTDNERTYQRLLPGVLAELRTLLGDGSVNIEPAYFPQLERQTSGKFRPVLSLCRPAEIS